MEHYVFVDPPFAVDVQAIRHSRSIARGKGLDKSSGTMEGQPLEREGVHRLDCISQRTRTSRNFVLPVRMKVCVTVVPCGRTRNNLTP